MKHSFWYYASRILGIVILSDCIIGIWKELRSLSQDISDLKEDVDNMQGFAGCDVFDDDC